MTKRFSAIAIVSLGLMTTSSAWAQTSKNANELAGQVNTITTAVPFLTIAPDSRAGAMGDVGAATSPDANSIHWNASKLAFIDKKSGFSLSYIPWLKALVNDINLTYLSGFYKLDDKQTIAGSLLYFSLGELTGTDINNNYTGTLHPNEYAFDVAYSRKINENFAAGVALRYIRSDLTNGQAVQGEDTKAANAVAGDVSAYYKTDIEIGDKKTLLAFGANVSNIGNKIAYRNSANRNFLPTNLRLGVSGKMALDKYNSIALHADINKLLVPTPPVYDSTKYANGTQTVSDKSPVSGIFSSFNDAPGGFSEELKEINYSLGTEYIYDEQFALRAGYFHEDALKGNRQYATIGLGLKYNVFGLDFAYLIPTTSQRSPLENTLRFTLHFSFEAFASQNN